VKKRRERRMNEKGNEDERGENDREVEIYIYI
jgi:hypothetical protein